MLFRKRASRAPQEPPREDSSEREMIPRRCRESSTIVPQPPNFSRTAKVHETPKCAESDSGTIDRGVANDDRIATMRQFAMPPTYVPETAATPPPVRPLIG